MTTAPTVAAIAEEFATRLLNCIGPYQLDEVAQRNAAESNASVCHSHDFCDANVVMADAFESVTGRELDVASTADAETANAAWDAASKLFGPTAEAGKKAREIG